MNQSADYARCPAEVKVLDDRYGFWMNQCELPANHQGDHRHALKACEPVAYMGWPNAHSDGIEVPPRPVTDEDIAALPTIEIPAQYDGEA